MGKFIRVTDATSGLPVLVEADAIYVLAASSKEPGTVIWMKYNSVSVLVKQPLVEVEQKLITAQLPVAPAPKPSAKNGTAKTGSHTALKPGSGIELVLKVITNGPGLSGLEIARVLRGRVSGGTVRTALSKLHTHYELIGERDGRWYPIAHAAVTQYVTPQVPPSKPFKLG